jgi:hypothetical protein
MRKMEKVSKLEHFVPVSSPILDLAFAFRLLSGH